ncbi:phosphotransferase [Paenibacillus sp. OAS669]|uniref:phosphotransferase n=1 Tax=Paenibacillus sp. OAS669 TaxID=2663821 RepID=UPI0017899F52|nr:phosphotransferase [Paenibacillus sp. OAS669]MBE1445138.1 hypothetical protein [Paenibacillus sp. OAS669]
MTVLTGKQATVPIDSTTLQSVLNKKFPMDSNHIISWNIRPIGKIKPESEVHRIHCSFMSGSASSRCTVILKILRPDSNRAVEEHYYYWKREALVYQSGILGHLPLSVRAPLCYLIEERHDGSIWIWLEDMDEKRLDQEWAEEDQLRIAYEIGKFNGAYVTCNSLPTGSFLCRSWMDSWVQTIEDYSLGRGEQEAIWYKHRLEEVNPHVSWERFVTASSRIRPLLESLSGLPRVFAHQDIHSGNVYIEHSNGQNRIVVIDWQFASLSGVGEELGRMFGLMLRKPADPARYDIKNMKNALVEHYMAGLKEAGWDGDAACIKYGFAVSASLRFVMLMDKLLRAVEKPGYSVTKRDHLLTVLQLMLDMAEEAWALRRSLNQII